MASDRLVTHQHLLKAVMEYERRGSTVVLSELESLEPDLTEVLLEGLTQLFHQLTKLGVSGRDAREAYRRSEKTTVVCIMALRKAHHDLWQRDHVHPEPPAPDTAP